MNTKKLAKWVITNIGLNIVAPLNYIMHHDVASYDAKVELEKLHAYSTDSECSCLRNKGIEIKPEYDLDIIIPCYNVEKYIKDCIESILNQNTKYKYHVFLIDDGSTDHTRKLLDTYKSRSNVSIIHRENAGPSAARNSALSYLKSRYVMFVDSDDYIPENAVELLLSKAYEKDAELVQGAFLNVSDNGVPQLLRTVPEGKVNPLNDLTGFAWGKVIKSNYFKDLIFPEGYWYEDSIMRQILYPRIVLNRGGVYGISDCVYYYRQNPKSIMRSSGVKPKVVDVLYITVRLHKDALVLGLPVEQDNYEYILDEILLNYKRGTETPKEIQYACFCTWIEFLNKYFAGFTTNRRERKKLEESLLTKNYELYQLAGKLSF